MSVARDSDADVRGADVRRHEPPGGAAPLRREHGCRQDLLWRADLARPEVDALLSFLAARCRRVGPAGRGVALFEAPAGHGVVLVPRTGRLQLRVAGTTPRGEREAAARALYRWLRAGAEEGPSS